MTGFVNIDKREGVSSVYAVNRVKRLSGVPCGHLGTLDPLASGVLPVGIGNATRLFNYFLEKEKTYLARFRFGVTSKSLDRESELLFGGRVPSCGEIEAVLPHFLGEIEQVPPAFSAISVGGKRSYEYARQGKEVPLNAKRVRISAFRLLGQTGEDEFAFEIVCGGGTYIRSLARDLANALGTEGFMAALRRTQSGVFTEKTAVELDALTAENLIEYLIPTEDVLPFPALEMDDERLYHGLALPWKGENGQYKLYRGGQFYGLARVENGLVKAEKKLC